MSKRIRFTSLLALALVPCANAHQVTRGPYLQMLTPDSVTVCWRTDGAAANRIHYGELPGRLDQIAGSEEPLTNHAVRIPGLKADTRYFYSVDAVEPVLAGDPTDFYFFTAPPPGEPKPIRIWVLGDSGTANTDASAVRNAYFRFTGSRRTDLWLMLGDNAYTHGSDVEYQKALFDEYPAMLHTSPLWPTLGNHDIKCCDVISQSGIYYDTFALPTRGQAGGIRSWSEAYYSFDYGNVHFICLDSNQTDYSPRNPMLRWLGNDLRANHRDWTIAYFHHPPYSRGKHDSDLRGSDHMCDVREHIVPLLETGGTDLVLTGHSHSYERSFLLDGHLGKSDTFCDKFKKNGGDGREDGLGAYYKPTLGPAPHEGTVYVVAGSSGQVSGGKLNHPAMLVSTNSLGSLVLDINSNRLDATFINSRAERLDHFTIIKGAKRP